MSVGSGGGELSHGRYAEITKVIGLPRRVSPFPPPPREVVTPRHTAMALAYSNRMFRCKVRSPAYLMHEPRDDLIERAPAVRVGGHGREPVVVLAVAAEQRRAARAAWR